MITFMNIREKVFLNEQEHNKCFSSVIFYSKACDHCLGCRTFQKQDPCNKAINVETSCLINRSPVGTQNKHGTTSKNSEKVLNELKWKG